MKKIMKLRIVLVALLGVFSLSAFAQMGPLPVDPQVRTGKLENGLTYYIRHNELPKGQAEFYIAQKVGSMQEEEEQRGLAHFLEHMAFNGTEHFPGKGLTEYLESIGVKFGYNINAYTGFDETVYTLMGVPVSREGVVDSCLLILYDWSCGIALEDEEIDAERSVIHEEWRTGQSAQMRIFDQTLPVIFEGSRYGHRLPIGLMEVVDHFPYPVIRDYYHKWYRPDLQGIIVVGDVDVDAVENKIKTLFAQIELPENPAERVYFEVPDNKEPIFAFATDKELTNVRMEVNYKHDPIPMELRNTSAFLVQGYISSVVASMFHARFDELIHKANPPFIAAGVYDDKILGITETKEAFTTVAISNEATIEQAFRALLTETRRVDEHGFTASEYERARANFLQGMETAYNEREKQQTRSYMEEYKRAFLHGEPIPGIEMEYQLYQQFAPMLPVEMINQYVKELISDENIVIIIQGPAKEGFTYPAKEELLAIFNAVRTSDTEAYAEEISDEPLVGNLPAPGAIIGTSHDGIFDATVWTLSNGATVVIKPTPYKDDEIMMQAVSKGGSSLIGSQYDNEVNFMGELAELGGLGNFSATDLVKVLAGKQASASVSIGELDERVMANCAPRDLETMMQLVYLQFTGIRKDQDAFESWQNRMSMLLQNLAANPQIIYQDSLYSVMYNNNPRQSIPTPAEVQAVNYDKALELTRQRFADASDFTFIFVGNVDEAALKPFVEQYIASLPASNSREKAGQPILIQNGKLNSYFEKTVESPKVTSAFVYSAMMEASLKNAIEMDAFWQILFSRYFESMREDEGGTYSPQVQGMMASDTGEAMLFVKYDTNAEQYERLAVIVAAEIEKLAQEGPSDADFNKVKEYMLKKETENLQQNAFWMRRLNTYYLLGLDYQSGYTEAVKAMTKADIQAFAKRLVEAGNVLNVTMNGIAAQ